MDQFAALIIFVLLCVARSGWNISCQVARRGEQVLKLAVVAGAAILPRPLSVLGELRRRLLLTVCI